MSTPGPGATGTLAATPLAELLIYALVKKLSGSLVFETGDGTKSALAVRDGVVRKSRLSSEKHRLGDVCVQHALVSDAVVARALAERGTMRLGQKLVEFGLSQAELQEALQAQLLLHVQTIAALAPDTVYGYYAGQDFLERWGGPEHEVDPLATVWRAARSAHNPRALKLVRRLQGLPELRLHRHSRVARFQFSSREKALLDVLRAKPQPYDSLLATGLLEPDAVARVVYVLALTRHLDVGDDNAFPLGVDAGELHATRTAASGTTPPTAPSKARQGAIETERPVDGKPARAQSDAPGGGSQEIVEMQERVVKADYYELLGLARDTDAAAIQAAFFQLARKWHPDKLPPHLSEHREAVTHIFARMTEAHRVLSNPAQRSEYDRLSSEEGDSEEEQAKVQKVLRAAVSFQKAEVLGRRGDWAAAERTAMQAVEDDPDQAEYAAFRAYAVMNSGQRKESQDYSDLLAMLDKAVEREPKNVRIKYYRAQVAKRAGKIADAMRDFRAVVEAEPNNVEAQRELRLFKMRRGDANEERAESGGLLGKLFGKG